MYLDLRPHSALATLPPLLLLIFHPLSLSLLHILNNRVEWIDIFDPFLAQFTEILVTYSLIAVHIDPLEQFANLLPCEL